MLEMSNTSLPSPFAFIAFSFGSHEAQERISRMRVILCPREIGRNTRQDNEATAELSHGGASVLP